MGDEPRPRLLTRSFVLLTVADLAYFTSIGVAILALPLTVTGRIGSDEAGAGLAFGAFGVTALLCRPYAGRLSDRHGRRPLMMAGALGCALGMLLLPHVDSLALVVALRLFQGVAEAAFFVAAFAMLADVAPASRLGEALSYNSLGLYLGIGLGPLLGEALAQRWGLPVAWYGATTLAVVAALLALLLEEPDHPDHGTGHGRLLHRPAIPLGVGFLASLGAVSGFLAFAALHSREIGLANTSLALLTYGLVVVVCRLAFARVPDRLPSLPLAAASLAAIGLGMAVMAAWQRPAGLLVGVVVTAVGVTFATPAFFAAIFATAAPSERGAASGTASAFIDLGLGAGPILLGLVARSGGIPAAFAVGAAIALAGMVWTLGLARAQSPSGTRTQSAM
jgi:predicted MFS family arabinose efflux permease